MKTERGIGLAFLILSAVLTVPARLQLRDIVLVGVLLSSGVVLIFSRRNLARCGAAIGVALALGLTQVDSPHQSLAAATCILCAFGVVDLFDWRAALRVGAVAVLAAIVVLVVIPSTLPLARDLRSPLLPLLGTPAIACAWGLLQASRQAGASQAGGDAHGA